ncbi:MAG: hypothetical protein HRT88_10735 [Lentisphaeraceae bacterium]|nr:hypothetical protein [Lentisphaeraceae bacterium]
MAEPFQADLVKLKMVNITNLKEGMFGETYHVAASMIIPLFSDLTELYIVDHNRSDISTAQILFLSHVQSEVISYFKQTKKTVDLLKQGNTKSPSLSDLTYEFCANLEKNDIHRVRYVTKRCFLPQKEQLKKISDTIESIYSTKLNKLDLIIRVRNSSDPQSKYRNMSVNFLNQLIGFCKEEKMYCGLIGDDIEYAQSHNVLKLFNFKAKIKAILSDDGILLNDFILELAFSTFLMSKKRNIIQTGMLSGALDGSSFIGMKTIFFAPDCRIGNSQDRMSEFARVFPNVERIGFFNDYNADQDQRNTMPTPYITTFGEFFKKLSKPPVRNATDEEIARNHE